ncbi:ComEC/Rec2 family competence protein [Enemella sp. A6]|uniref:ComEC/Rec2 family competence protein n=1 Tax=Enemella sp. A6 TaxID=3440152 RepID=UPI003EB80927
MNPDAPTAAVDTAAANTGGDYRLAPIAAAAWLAMWVATSGIGWWAIAVVALAAVIAVVAWVRRSWLLLAVAVVLAAALAFGVARHSDRHSGLVAQVADRGGGALVQAEITGDPRPGRGQAAYAHARATVVRMTVGEEHRRLRSPVVLVVTGRGSRELVGLPVGTVVQARVQVEAADRGDDVAAVLRTTEVQVVAGPDAGLRLVERVRGGLRDAVADAPPAQRALVPALVLGDISAMPDELREDFVRTGLTHLTAVSGANLTYLLVFLTVGARAIGVRGRWLQVVGVLAVAIFVALCRTEPSVLRAAAMGLVTVAALSVVGAPRRGAPRRGVRHLSVAVLTLVLIDPWLSRSIGFVLSVTASAGIIVWARGWTDALAGWLPRPVAEAIAVPLAAQLATQPVVTAISGEISLVALLANALAGPAVGPATVLGFGAAGASLLHPAPAGVLGFAAGWCAQVVIWVAEVGAGFPGSAITFQGTTSALVWLVAVVTLSAPLITTLLRRRWVMLAMAVVLVIAVLRGPTPPGWPPPNWLVVACDVGQGDALAIRAAPGQVVVVDTGEEPLLLQQCLSELGARRVPLLMLSHFHSDHVGATEVVNRMPVDLVLVSPLPSPRDEAVRVDAQFGERILVGRPGQRFEIGQVRVEVLGPTRVPKAAATSDGESSTENDASIGALIEVDGVRVLLTGDLTAEGQRRLARDLGTREVDVLKVAHHGSADFDPALIRAADAPIAVISVGADNSYGHPAPSLLRALTEHRMTIARTDQHGAVAIVRDGDRVRVIGRNP